MVSPSRCPPWQPERPGPTRREPRRAQRSYTTPRDTILCRGVLRFRCVGERADDRRDRLPDGNLPPGQTPVLQRLLQRADGARVSVAACRRCAGERNRARLFVFAIACGRSFSVSTRSPLEDDLQQSKLDGSIGSERAATLALSLASVLGRERTVRGCGRSGRLVPKSGRCCEARLDRKLQPH